MLIVFKSKSVFDVIGDWLQHLRRATFYWHTVIVALLIVCVCVRARTRARVCVCVWCGSAGCMRAHVRMSGIPDMTQDNGEHYNNVW